MRLRQEWQQSREKEFTQNLAVLDERKEERSDGLRFARPDLTTDRTTDQPVSVAKRKSSSASSDDDDVRVDFIFYANYYLQTLNDRRRARLSQLNDLRRYGLSTRSPLSPSRQRSANGGAVDENPFEKGRTRSDSVFRNHRTHSTTPAPSNEGADQPDTPKWTTVIDCGGNCSRLDSG
jgi:hypothetical protein